MTGDKRGVREAHTGKLALFEASEKLLAALTYTDIVAMAPDLAEKTFHAHDVGLLLRCPGKGDDPAEARLLPGNTPSPQSKELPRDHLLRELMRRTEAEGGVLQIPPFDFPGDQGKGERYGSALAYSLRARGRILGSLILLRRKGVPTFVDVELKKGMIFANHLALALDNALLREELESRLADLQKANETLSLKSEQLHQASLEKVKAEERFRHLATHDHLTNLPNRLLLHDRLAVAIARAKRYKQYIGILLIDLDRFKEINDALGHISGDMLIREVASRIVGSVRNCDTVARMGGDEFIVVLNDLAEKPAAKSIIDRVLQTFASPFTISGREITITPSMGISYYPDDGEDIETLLKDADLAMYSTKAAGGNSYSQFSQSMNRDAEEKMLITTALRKAVELNELALFYQPLIEMRTGKIAGVEALIRWERSTGGMVSPLSFIPVAESTGLIIPIGEWVLKTACRQIVTWQNAGFPPVPVAVNISARQLHEQDFSDRVIGILDATGLDPKYLILEITESTAMEDIEESIKILSRLYKKGIQIFIDDFGSGYSSIGRLKSLPAHALKIDHLFTQHIVDDPDDAAIVMSIMAMAHSLGIRVVVEGVETPAQLECLRSMKWTIDYPLQCDEVQGYLFSRPVPADDFTKLFIRQREHGILPTMGCPGRGDNAKDGYTPVT